MSEEVSVAGYRWDHHHGVIICQHVFEGTPVRLFCFENDRDLQFMCGADNHLTADDYENAGLIHVLEHHPEIGSLPDMVPGQWAERSDENSEWIIGELEADKVEGTNP